MCIRDRLVARSATGGDLALFGQAAAALALDGSAFVVDTCDEGQCRLRVIDTVTGASRDVDHVGDPICRLIGVADGVAVAATQPVCKPFDLDPNPAGAAIVALPLDGSPSRDLVRGSTDGLLVATPTGARLIRVDSSASGTEVGSVDVATGDATVIVRRSPDEPFVAPVDLRLPSGWVLLATFSLGDYPQASPVDRSVPILVDLTTGQQYEMVNLPH